MLMVQQEERVNTVALSIRNVVLILRMLSIVERKRGWVR